MIRTSLVLSNPEPDLDSTLNWFLLILLLLSFPYSCLFLGGFRFTFLGTFLSRRRPLLFSWNPSALKSSYPSLPSSLLTGSSELDNPSSGAGKTPGMFLQGSPFMCKRASFTSATSTCSVPQNLQCAFPFLSFPLTNQSLHGRSHHRRHLIGRARVWLSQLGNTLSF